MRIKSRVDANQKKIVEKLRSDPAYSVHHLHTIGKGCPDLLVGAYGVINLLVEIKDPEKPPSKRQLTKDENIFFEQWKGAVMVAYYAEEIIERIEKLYAPYLFTKNIF